MEMKERVILVSLVFFINFFLFSCKKNNSELLKLTVNDLTNKNNKNVKIVIEQDSINNKYYLFITQNNEIFEKPYFTFEYKGYNFSLLNNNTNFNLEHFGVNNLNLKQPSELIKIDKTDGFKTTSLMIYEIENDIIKRRLKYDAQGELIKEDKIDFKYN